MKKVLLFLGAILFASAVGVEVYAYNYINSSTFVRMPARAATISTPDSVYYNPVGLVKLPNGFYTEIGNNFVVKEYSHKLLAGSYTDDTPVLFNMFGAIVFKGDKGALFICNYVPDGGGMSDYRNKGGLGVLLAETGNFISYLHAYRFWVQIAMGGAYQLTDWLAITGGLFANIYYYDVTLGLIGGGSVANYTWRANGWSGWAGFMLSPTKAIDFTVKYGIECIARGKVTDKKLHYSKIDEARLPAYVLLGLNVRPHEKVEIQASYQLSFTQQKDYANTLTGAREFYYGNFYPSPNTSFIPTIGGNTQDFKHKLTHAAGIGAEIRVHERILVSAGIGYENAWLHPRAQNPYDPKLASIATGLGARLQATHTMNIDLGILKNTYFDDEMMYGFIKLKKNVWVFSMTLSTKWM